MITEPAHGTDEAAILAVIREDVAAYMAKDIARLSACYVQDARMTSIIGQRGMGLLHNVGFDAFRAQIGRLMAAIPEPSRAPVTQHGLRITVRGDVAWAVFEERVGAGDDPMNPPASSHNMRVFERIDGRWLISLHAVFEPHAASVDGPLVEVDGEGRVLWSNPQATARLRRDPNLELRSGRLRAVDPTRHDVLARTIRKAADLTEPSTYYADLKGAPGVSFPVVVGTGPGGAPALALISVQDFRAYVAFGDDDLFRRRVATAAVVFGLSEAQTRLAAEIAGGRDLPEAAATMGITVNTARTHLRRMFDKTGTSSQTALLRALLVTG